MTNPDSNARLVLHQGLRNPFRFGIDRVTGALVIGDGGGQYGRLDYVTRPANLEWPLFEGTLVGPMTCPGSDSRFQPPIYSPTTTSKARR